VHDVSFFVGPQWFKPRDRILLQRFVPPSVRRAKRVITVSETSRRDIERYIPEAAGKVSVTPLASNVLISAVPKEVAHQMVKADFGLDAPYLLTVGTRWPRKNMALAVRAATLLPPSIPHRLVITGHSGWGEEGQSPRALSTGYVTEAQLSALYSAAELYVAPSFYEGFGLPLLEAFTCGCPVLCSSGGSFPEVAGDAAEIEATWDAEHWAATMQGLLSDSSKLDAMRQRGYERVKDFSWEKTARLTEDVYREAAVD
jgi:glycosyltransferase involved in cell wall biosynthesis